MISSACIRNYLARHITHRRIQDSHILEALFFVTAAITPPPPLSFAVPFFLPFFVGICAPADVDFWICLLGWEGPPEVWILFVS